MKGVTYLLLVVMASLYSTIVMATLTLVPVQYAVDDDRQTLDGGRLIIGRSWILSGGSGELIYVSIRVLPDAKRDNIALLFRQ